MPGCSFDSRLAASSADPSVMAAAEAERDASAAYGGPLASFLSAERAYGVARYAHRAAIGRVTAQLPDLPARGRTITPDVLLISSAVDRIAPSRARP